MTCAYERERLSLYVNDDLLLPERREVEAHLAGCADCRRVVAQYREGAAHLASSLQHLTAPAQGRAPARGGRWLWAPAIAAVLLVMVAAVPQARAEVARLFGWHSITVEPAPPPAAGPEGAAADPGKKETPSDGATVVYDRELSRENPEPAENQTTRSVADARSFLGHGVALPPELEGQEMYLYKMVDKDGRLQMIGLSEPNIGFWARYRPDGQFEQINATYGNAFDVQIEERVIGNRPARIVTATQKGGKASVEIWIQDGNWIYEVHGYGRDLPKILAMVEGME